MNLDNIFITSSYVCQYIPIVSTVSCGTEAFEKLVMQIFDIQNPKSEYFKHVKAKPLSHIAWGMLPVIGNIRLIFLRNNPDSSDVHSASSEPIIPLGPSDDIMDQNIGAIEKFLHEKYVQLSFIGLNLKGLKEELSETNTLLDQEGIVNWLKGYLVKIENKEVELYLVHLSKTLSEPGWKLLAFKNGALSEDELKLPLKDLATKPKVIQFAKKCLYETENSLSVGIQIPDRPINIHLHSYVPKYFNQRVHLIKLIN